MKSIARILTLAALALATVAVNPVPSSIAAPVPEGATWEQVWFPSQDGTQLRADVLLPADRAETDRHPVILAIGPYFGRNALNDDPGATGPVDRFGDMVKGGKIFENGYAYVQVDSRGYGGSEGCNDFGGAGEQMDTEAAVTWAAEQPWSNGRVGMWGKSYDGWTQVMALAENPAPLEAVVIQSPLIETYRGMFMNGVHWDEGWYATPSLYSAYDLAPSTPGDPAPEEYLYPAKGTLTDPACIPEKTAFTATYDHDLPYWQERDIIAEAGRSDIPTLWSHGFNDVNTKPTNFLPVWSELNDGPKRAWFGQYAHDRGNEVEKVGRDGFLAEAMDWFDHFLKGEPLVSHPAIEVQDTTGSWRTEQAWPPVDVTYGSLELRDGSYTDNNSFSAGSSNQNNPTAGPGNALWSITQPAPYDLRFGGEPILSATVDTQVPNANLAAVLYDVAPDGTARRITRGAYLLEQEGEVSFELMPQDAIIPQGHRVGVAIAGSDSSIFLPTNTQTSVTVSEASIALPFLRYQRVYNLDGGPARAQSSVEQRRLTPEQIEAVAVTVEFPPPLAGTKKKTSPQ
ncbi:MAG: CocE/NonD family hydrolase [Actinomycetota bacterium]|nr:CocE/NonD family hydrolase [Actinomycetota bacterium]